MRSMVQYLGFIAMFSSFFSFGGQTFSRANRKRGATLVQSCAPFRAGLGGFNTLCCQMGKEGISSLSRLAQISSFEGNSNSTFGVVALVDGVVNPPGAVVIPEVMIQIF